MTPNVDTCKVCGARVRFSARSLTKGQKTCDSICRRAAGNGWTREQQFNADMNSERREWESEERETRQRRETARIMREDDNLNQNYANA